MANRYSLTPFDVLDWDVPHAVALYYSAARNRIRERIDHMTDRMATNEISMEIKHYDKHGKEIKGDGRVEAVGFKKHIEHLYRLIGVETEEAQKPQKDGKEVADEMLKFFMGALGGGG